MRAFRGRTVTIDTVSLRVQLIDWPVIEGSLKTTGTLSGKTALPRQVRRRGWLSAILMCVAVLSAPGQTPSSKDQPDTNWSQACGHFSQELQNLSEILALTENQQAEIKPILEQETVRVTEICSNPVFSRVDEVNQYKRIVRASDEKTKPLLSASQLQKLQNLRKDQKQDLEEIIAKQMSTQ